MSGKWGIEGKKKKKRLSACRDLLWGDRVGWRLGAGVKNADESTRRERTETSVEWGGEDKTHSLDFLWTPQGWQDVGLDPQCLGGTG